MLMKRYSILFWLNPSRYKNVYLRLTINGKRAEISTGIHCDPQIWDSQRLTDNQMHNKRLHRIALVLEDLIDKEPIETLTASRIKQKYSRRLAYHPKVITLLEGLKMSNQGKTGNAVYSIIEECLGNIYFHELGLKHFQKLDTHMINKKYSFSTRKTYFSWLKARVTELFLYCADEDMLSPQQHITLYPVRMVDKDIKEEKQKWLDQDEFDRLIKAMYPSDPYLESARLTFLFQCYTGLGISEVVAFDPAKHIVKDIKGNSLIKMQRKKTRKKTGIFSTIPLFPETQDIINKLNAIETPYSKSQFVPIKKNKSHSNIQFHMTRVAKRLGIAKLTPHMGRHTFAVNCLIRGFTMESVSAMLGHSSIATTQKYYGKITEHRVIKELNRILAVK